MTLPAESLRTNRGTWAVPAELLPAVGNWLHDAAPNEPFDPHFAGQRLVTTYFDTDGFDLRKARLARQRYLTLRVRCYYGPKGHAYALSAKTEGEKWRAELPAAQALNVLANPSAHLPTLLPPHLAARLAEIAADAPLQAAVSVSCRRYAVEDDVDRFTLDVAVETDTGKCLPGAVLEYKSTDADAEAPGPLARLGLRPVKLSKFLWATDWR